MLINFKSLVYAYFSHFDKLAQYMFFSFLVGMFLIMIKRAYDTNKELQTGRFKKENTVIVLAPYVMLLIFLAGLILPKWTIIYLSPLSVSDANLVMEGVSSKVEAFEKELRIYKECKNNKRLTELGVSNTPKQECVAPNKKGHKKALKTAAELIATGKSQKSMP